MVEPTHFNKICSSNWKPSPQFSVKIQKMFELPAPRFTWFRHRFFHNIFFYSPLFFQPKLFWVKKTGRYRRVTKNTIRSKRDLVLWQMWWLQQRSNSNNNNNNNNHNDMRDQFLYGQQRLGVPARHADLNVRCRTSSPETPFCGGQVIHCIPTHEDMEQLGILIN